MEQEIELKLMLPDGIDPQMLSDTVGRFGGQVDVSEFSLFNEYFDTPDKRLSDVGIGLRVRRSAHGIEQTVKTAGHSVGGLSQRPEFNIAIESTHPDLTLFDASIWPASIDVNQLQQDISGMFYTDFVRVAYMIRFSDGTEIELVHDKGLIKAGENQSPINEIELELKKGNVSKLFDLAQTIIAVAPCQMGNISKAGRGFLLAKHQQAPDRKELHSAKLNREATVEQGLIASLEYALQYWQSAEYRYLHTNKINALYDVHNGLLLTAECIKFYNAILSCPQLAELKQMLASRLSRLAWVGQVKSIKALRAKRGLYSKKLSQHDALTSYLRGLQDGTLNLSKPRSLLTQFDNTSLQLALSRLLCEKPWHEDDQCNQALRPHASHWLNTKWQKVFDALTNKGLSVSAYLGQVSPLKNALCADLLIGSVMDSELRKPFTIPWQDVLDGVDECRTLTFLQTKLQDSDMDDKSDLMAWSEVKKNNLLAVIEQSKSFAMAAQTYW